MGIHKSIGTAGQESIYSTGDEETSPTYLDIQAEVGVSKHFGGFNATDKLHRYCHLEDAHEVLEVGCGIGVGPVYIAKRFDCQVVAIDISEKMLSWAKLRALREGVSDRITFRQADIQELPFEDDQFDAVIIESVLAFVKDKRTSIREIIRVTKPGGYVGLNEYCWKEEPPPEILAQSVYMGMATLTEGEWREIWEETSLEERTFEPLILDLKQEFRDRIKWVGGWVSILPIWGRVIKLLLSTRQARQAVRQQIDIPREVANLMGYALLTGRKP